MQYFPFKIKSDIWADVGTEWSSFFSPLLHLRKRLDLKLRTLNFGLKSKRKIWYSPRHKIQWWQYTWWNEILCKDKVRFHDWLGRRIAQIVLHWVKVSKTYLTSFCLVWWGRPAGRTSRVQIPTTEATTVFVPLSTPSLCTDSKVVVSQWVTDSPRVGKHRAANRQLTTLYCDGNRGAFQNENLALLLK